MRAAFRFFRPIGVPAAQLPRLEGTVPLPDGRRLGYAEFGDPQGPLVLWFHGSPGARRQVPPLGRRAAERLGLRVVCVERPGVGDSTDHLYGALTEWPADAVAVADRLGQERFMIVGLSGGGPYALATAHEFPDRVVAVALLGSLVPTAGDDSAAGGLVALSHRFNRELTALRLPLGWSIWGFMRAVNPAGRALYRAFARAMPEGDRRVLADGELEAMFIDDITVGGAKQFQAMVNDFVLIGRPWGFQLGDIRVPVRWWHGDADPFVPLDQAQRTAARLGNVELIVRPGQSHLGEFAAAEEVLETLARLWRETIAA